MQESQIVQRLLQIAREEGYTIKYTTIDAPEINFTDKYIELRKEDTTLFHIAHEVAHVFIGVHRTKKQKSLNEALAETVALRIRQYYGFPVTDEDFSYIYGHLIAGKISDAAYAAQMPRIERIIAGLISRIGSTDNAYPPFGRRSQSPVPVGS